MGRRKIRNFNLLSRYDRFVPGWKGLAGILLMMLAGVAVGAVFIVALGKLTGLSANNEYLTLLSYPLMFIPAMMYSSVKASLAAPDSISVPIDRGPFSAGNALASAVAVISLSIVCDPLTTLLPPMPDNLREAMESLTGGNIVINFICVGIMAPFFEEWLCRGMVCRGLRYGAGTGIAVSIVLSSLFFALIHANLWQGIPAFCFGCLFGFVYMKTGSLKLTMLMHCVNNTLSLFISRTDAFKDADCLLDVMPPHIFWPLFAAAVLTLAFCVRKFQKSC